MTTANTQHWGPEDRLLTGLAVLVSFFAFVVYLRGDCILLYGDAVAHMNIARRVFDSKTPGLLQLGTVWLPLPHLLMMPFLVSVAAWQSGIGASVPSMVAYVFAVLGIFRLVRTSFSHHATPKTEARTAAWFAAIMFGANPNLIYLQTTAMTEPFYLALFLWAMVYFVAFKQALELGRSATESFSAPLNRCALCLAAAEFTRYDGWLAACVISLAAILVTLTARRHPDVPKIRRALVRFVIVVAAAPAIWLAYNAIIYHNPLEFANGPYSAKAIEKRSATPGFPSRPGSGDIIVAAQYFVKSAEDNVAEGPVQRVWIAIALLGSLLCLFLDRSRALLLLLWLPLPFYVYSIAYGGVPIFVPNWWPFSYYNVRYGIELLPAVAVFSALVLHYALTLARPVPGKIAIALIAFAAIAGSYFVVWRTQPVSFREAWFNSRSRIALEKELASSLSKLPPGSTILMYLGDHVGALQDAGIPLKQVINEGNHRTWKQPTDPQGLWELALANPAEMADYAVGIGDDPVGRSARQHSLTSLAIIQTPGQPPATIYSTRKP